MFVNPQYLIEPESLQSQLGDPSLRILACTVFLRPSEEPGRGFVIESGHSRWAENHIPGSAFADLARDLRGIRNPTVATPASS